MILHPTHREATSQSQRYIILMSKSNSSYVNRTIHTPYGSKLQLIVRRCCHRLNKLQWIQSGGFFVWRGLEIRVFNYSFHRAWNGSLFRCNLIVIRNRFCLQISVVAAISISMELWAQHSFKFLRKTSKWRKWTMATASAYVDSERDVCAAWNELIERWYELIVV